MRNRIRLIARFLREAGIRWLVPLSNMRLRYNFWIEKGLENFYKIIEHYKK
jgi:hypothetical protein